MAHTVRRYRNDGDTMNILAIESSCDETAVAVVRDGRSLLADCISSQVDIHKLYGGVVPEIASRKHIETIYPLAEQAPDPRGRHGRGGRGLPRPGGL